MYDPLSRKQFVKSLETTDRVKALATARNLFQQIKGKIAKNERLVSITTAELIEKHIERLNRTVTNVPHMGITPESLRLKSITFATGKTLLTILVIQKLRSTEYQKII